MNAKQLAQQMKLDDLRERQVADEMCKARVKERENQHRKYTEWILAELDAFKPEFNTVKKWFAGSDYYLLVAGCKNHVSCVITDEGIRVQKSEWSGPHDSSPSYICNNLTDLQRYIALCMKDSV